jgi:hypothetical protein
MSVLAFIWVAMVPPLLSQQSTTRDVIDSVEATVVRQNRDGKGTTWFHPRGCLVPTPQGPIAFMTLQEITGSDYFGPVHWSMSTDQAKTWSDPQPVPGLGRVPAADGMEEGVCDVVPEYHDRTNSVLAMGHNVFYKVGKKAFFNPQPQRWPVYAVRRANGTWSERQRFIWDDPRASMLLACGCGQRVNLADGDVLIPVSFSSKDKPMRSVTTLLCSFDGKTLSVKKAGREIPGKTGRGFIEPSLALLDGVFYMTIRSEDGRGYVTRSRDGLTWDYPVPWAWQNGDPLVMSTTQQHWLTHSDTLYLVYTRKSTENTTVFRWRAPLYLAAVDRHTMCVVAGTERVVFPIKGDGIKNGKNVAYSGNFHTMPLNAEESLITDGETFPANGYKGDQLQAHIRWKVPNQLVP